jgi:hypothetical protein
MTFSIWLGGRAATGPFSDAVLRKVISNVAMQGRWECLSVVSTKISFSQTELMQPGRMLAGSRRDRSLMWVYAGTSAHKNRTARIGLVRAMRCGARRPLDSRMIASGDRRGCAGSDLGL